MSVSLQQHMFQTNLVLVKIQATSLFIRQSMQDLLLLNLNQLEAQQVETKNISADDYLRPLLKFMRTNTTARETFTGALQQRFPFLSAQCSLVIRLHSSYMLPFSQKTSHEETPELWADIFQHFLTLAFIHPRMFVISSNQSVYPVCDSVTIISKSWAEFLQLKVPLSFETSSLTAENLHAHTHHSISPSVAPSAVPSMAPSVVPSLAPSLAPSMVPSMVPSLAPSVTPSVASSMAPSPIRTFSRSHIPPADEPRGRKRVVIPTRHTSSP